MAGENAEGDDIGRAFPPIVVGKEKTNSGNNQCGAEVAGFAQAVKGIDYFLLWQRGQKCDERAPKVMRLMGVPQRGHGSSSWPYAARDCSKKPDSPLTLIYRSSNEVPPWLIASCMTSVAKSMMVATFLGVSSEVRVSGWILARHKVSSA